VLIAVCVKWVDLRPEVDPLTGAVRVDTRFFGVSDADQAALEWGLRLAADPGDRVVAVTAGPVGAEAALRDCLAAGAAEAVRIDLDPAAPSWVVAAGLARGVPGADLVLCGDWSLDRGSGSVPAFLAAELGAAQALGLVDLAVAPDGSLLAERRLDQGRRERLSVRPPAVASVEGGTAELRRAPLSAVLRARTAAIPVVAVAVRQDERLSVEAAVPFRPRPRVLPPPPADLSTRERVLRLTGALVDRQPPQVLQLDPEAAADAILEHLRSWGYLDEP
jgi:electron transfer flavoprotein beta subunit